MPPLVLHHHPHRAPANLGRILVRWLAHSGSTFSGVVASCKPGAVHCPLMLLGRLRQPECLQSSRAWRPRPGNAKPRCKIDTPERALMTGELLAATRMIKLRDDHHPEPGDEGANRSWAFRICHRTISCAGYRRRPNGALSTSNRSQGTDREPSKPRKNGSAGCVDPVDCGPRRADQCNRITERRLGGCGRCHHSCKYLVNVVGFRLSQ